VSMENHGGLMSTGDLLIHPLERSLAIIAAEPSISLSGESGRRKFWILSTKYLFHTQSSLTCHKMLRHGTDGFTSPPKEGVMQIFIALKSPSPWRVLNPRSLGPVVNTLPHTIDANLCSVT
jgi:hypothetical protein